MGYPTASVEPQAVLGLPDPGERVPRLAIPTVGLYVATLGLFGIYMYGLFEAHWSAWLLVPMGAAITFLMFTVLHEATHHAVSSNTRLNNAFGHLSMHFVGPYATFPMLKYVHIEHHRNTNEPKTIDPDHWTSEGPWWQLPFRWAVLDLWYVVFYLRNFNQRPRRESYTVLAVFIGVLAALAWFGTHGFGREVLIYLAGGRLGFAVLAWWFDYLPHNGLTTTQREDKYRATRVRVGQEWLLTPLFVYQNYHLVHHLHPSVPFYRYVRAWRRNETAYLDRNAAISTWFGRSLTASEYRTWRRLTDSPSSGSAQRPLFHPLRVASVESLTSDSSLVRFEVPSDLAHEYAYTQGQHLTLRAIIEGHDVRRSYSIIEPVSANVLTVAVKRIEGGVFSNYVSRTLRVGDVLDVMTPTGRFRTDLDPSAARHYVAVVAGSGITPLMSIVRTTLEVEPLSRFTLVYGNRTPQSTMFAAELDEAAGERLTIHHVLSRTPGAPLAGRISGQLVRDLVADQVDAWFLCGPQSMVEEVSSVLGPNEHVLTELFHTEATPSGVGVDIDSDVTIALDGIETSFRLRSTAETILDAALRSGLDAPYSCAGGACGTCRAKVLLGRTAMDQNHVLSDAEVANGYILTCQAHPISEEVRLDYDA